MWKYRPACWSQRTISSLYFYFLWDNVDQAGLLACNFWGFSCLCLPQSHGVSEKHSIYCIWLYVVLGSWTQVTTFAGKWFTPWPVSVAWDSAPLLPCFPACKAVVPETWQLLSKCAKWLSGWISVWSQGTEWGYQWGWIPGSTFGSRRSNGNLELHTLDVWRV